MKVSKEKGKRAAKRTTYAPGRRSEKDQEVKNPVSQEPNTSLPAYDGKQPFEKGTSRMTLIWKFPVGNFAR